MRAVRFSLFQGNNAVEAPVGWSGVEQQRGVIVLVRYMRVAAADDIDTAAKALTKQALIIVMGTELITVAYQKVDIAEGGFNQALANAGAVHIACYAQNCYVLRQPDMFKIICPVPAVNQIFKGPFASNDFLQVFAGSMAVGNN